MMIKTLLFFGIALAQAPLPIITFQAARVRSMTGTGNILYAGFESVTTRGMPSGANYQVFLNHSLKISLVMMQTVAQ
jgi:hypothetical protein